jgi:F-type H+-transporting ATPase subunit delta
LVVIKHRRAALLGEMAHALETELDDRLGRVRASVLSAAELDGARQNRLREELERMTGKQVRCEFHVDRRLIGGVSVRVGSTIYDGSVSGRLEALRHRMAAD